MNGVQAPITTGCTTSEGVITWQDAGVAGDDLWMPWSPGDTVAAFAAAELRWWISGGVALELHTGRTWRQHGDSDVGILRVDVAKLAMLLHDLDLCVAAHGVLRPWRGQPLASDRHENNIWCRPVGSHLWALDVTVNEGDHEPSRVEAVASPSVSKALAHNICG